MRRTEVLHRSRTRRGGFIYVWLLLSVALIALGLSRAAEAYRTSLQRENEASLLAIGHEFRAAFWSYSRVSLQGRNVSPFARYPTSLSDLLEDPRMAGTRRHLRKIYVDPMTGRAEWGLVKVGDRIVGVFSLSAREPIKQGNFDPEDLTLEGRSKLSEWWFMYPADMRALDLSGGMKKALPEGRS